MTGWIALTIVALGALLAATRLESRAGVWIAKPTASAGFIGVAVAAGALDSGLHGELMLLALGLSFIGDVLLIPAERESIFRAGILAFLLGHVAYLAAFARIGLSLWPSLLASLALLAFAWRVVRWLRPSLGGDMVVPVHAYVVVISLMMVSAVGAWGSSGEPRIAIGALMFLVSDVSVARDRFVSPGFANAAWGLPLYYGGQLVLASTAGPGVGAIG